MSPEPRKLPPHLQEAFQKRTRSIDDPQSAEESRRKALERRKLAIQFDIDQGELAQEPDNPWTHRIELLTEALANVEADLATARKVEPQPYLQLPAVPITDVVVSANEPYEVWFSIGAEQFRWQERLDWIERGGILAQPILEQLSGDIRPFIPQDYPHGDELRARLADAVSTYATVLRDARLNDESLPQIAALSELLPPCPTCGGWMDFMGHCNTCATRKVREHELFQERQHLMSERSSEAEERHRLAERLPLARKRMADLERELASLS